MRPSRAEVGVYRTAGIDDHASAGLARCPQLCPASAGMPVRNVIEQWLHFGVVPASPQYARFIEKIANFIRAEQSRGVARVIHQVNMANLS